MTKIYIVTEGEYSDYRICGVFDDKNLANLFCEKFGGSPEEWEINLSEELIKEGWNIYRVIMEKNGNTRNIELKDNWYSIQELQSNLKDIGFNYNFLYHNPYLLDTYVLAKNKQHAVKIANERRIRLIAEDKWKK